MSSLRRVPDLSLQSYLQGGATERARFIDDLYHSFYEYGFVVIKDHTIAPSLLNQAYSLCEELFALPSEAKNRYICEVGGGQRGYTPFGKEHAKGRTLMDLKEFWHVGRELHENCPWSYPENIWPSEIPTFRQTFLSIYSALEQTGAALLEALTYRLEVGPHFFEPLTNNGNSILRLLHYPPIPQGVDANCLRAAPHEDINLITLLVSATASGLQLKDRDGSWLTVESAPNTLVVNMGDMLSRMTNDVLPSTTHQVVNVDTGRSRYSMPFFLHPHPQAMLSCLPKYQEHTRKYSDITAHDFLMERLKEIGLY